MEPPTPTVESPIFKRVFPALLDESLELGEVEVPATISDYFNVSSSEVDTPAFPVPVPPPPRTTETEAESPTTMSDSGVHQVSDLRSAAPTLERHLPSFLQKEPVEPSAEQEAEDRQFELDQLRNRNIAVRDAIWTRRVTKDILDKKQLWEWEQRERTQRVALSRQQHASDISRAKRQAEDKHQRLKVMDARRKQ
ncbi:hypothetical protein KIPB_008793, partial [Kipferlia bialata]|eukprot:g8793.t1